MATSARPAASNGGGASAPARLPEIDVAKFEEAGYLLERLVDENQDLFIAKGNEFKQRHREGTRRPLRPEEAAQLAAAVIDDGRPVEERADAFQNQEGLYAYDEPDAREVLIAAGIATAPAAVKAARELVALIEMPNDAFWDALDESQAALHEAIRADAEQLRKLPLSDARARASAALTHFEQAAGASGKAGWLTVKAMLQALSQAMEHMSTAGSPSLSSLVSAPPESDLDATSSDSPTGSPSS